MTKSSDGNETTGSQSDAENFLAKGKRRVSLSMLSIKSIFTKKKRNLPNHDDTPSKNSTKSSRKSDLSKSSDSKDKVKADEIKSILSTNHQSINNKENDSNRIDNGDKKSVLGKKLSNTSFNFKSTCMEEKSETTTIKGYRII